MILTVDVGNSNVMFGAFEEEKLVFVARTSTNTSLTEDEYASQIMNVISLYNIDRGHISGAIISSVVPPLNTVIKKALTFLFGVTPLMVGPGIKTGINISCDSPSSVGADLITACVAVQHYHKTPCLVVDMGTATKMIAVGENGTFMGVSIIPGVLMGLDALADRTAQLPKISLEAPEKVIGKNTVDCMKSGVIFGNASMIDGMIERINEECGKELPVYATGGLASSITPHCKHEITLDEYLILKGLYVLFYKNN